MWFYIYLRNNQNVVEVEECSYYIKYIQNKLKCSIYYGSYYMIDRIMGINAVLRWVLGESIWISL